jgi:lambda family phage tail tape measure protein
MANIASTITISANAAGVGAATMVIKELGAAIIESVVAEDRMKMTMEAASGSAVLASRDLGYVRDVAQKMGQDLFATADGFVKLTAATRGTSLEGENTRKMFEALTAANAKLGGSSQQLEGMLRAVSQMVNKGVVSMEELRQQLGEHLPGAMRIAADSMNMPLEKLIKLISTGQLATEEFFNPFAEGLDKAFNNGKFETAGQSVQRLKNEWTMFVQDITDSSWVKDSADNLSKFLADLRGTSEEVKEITLQQSGKHLGEAMVDRGMSVLSNLVPSATDVREYLQMYNRIVYGEINETKEELVRKINDLYDQIDAAREFGWKDDSKVISNMKKELDKRVELYSKYWDAVIESDKAGADRELVAQGELQEKKIASVEAFRKVLFAAESSNGTDPNRKIPHDGGVIGDYQQKPVFMKEWNPGGDVNKTEDQLVALANFFEETRKKYDGNMIYVFAEYIAGSTNMAKAAKIAREEHISLEDALARKNPGTVADAIKRSNMYDDETKTGKQRQADIVRNYEEQEREKKRAADKALSEEQRKQERITQISITEHNKRLRLEDDTTSDLLEKSKIREANEIKMIQESMQRLKAEGMLTVKIEEDMQAQITNITKDGEKDREAIKKAMAEKEQERTRREAKDIASVNKWANDAALELARIEGRKTSAIILQSQIRRKAVEDQYIAELVRARGNANAIIALEQGKANKIKAINQEEKEALIKTNGSYTDKMKLHFTELERTSGDFTNQINEGFKDITLNGIDGMADALTNLATSGKASFKEFALSIIKDIEKMILKALIFKALSAAFGYGTGGGGAVIAQPGQNYAANGAVFDGSNAQFFAEGGVVERATPFAMSNGKTGIMGEAGPEAIMPLARGADGKLGVRGGGSSGGGNNVQVGAINVVVKSDPKSTPNQQGMEIGQAIKKEITQLIRMEVQDMHRPGNSLNQTRRI